MKAIGSILCCGAVYYAVRGAEGGSSLLSQFFRMKS